MTWSFGGVAFDWGPQDDGGAPTRPAWRQPPRLIVRPLLGTKDADVATVGYEAARIAGPIYVSAASAAALEALDGTAATLSDGASSWTAVLELELSPLLVASEGSVGTATFTRARGG